MIINGNGGYGLLAAYIGGPAAQVGWLGPKVGGHLAPFLYSSCVPSELSQWLCHDDSTMNIVVVIIIIIIIGVHNPHPKLQSLLSKERVKLQTSNLPSTFTGSI